MDGVTVSTAAARETAGSRLEDLYALHAPRARRFAYLLTGDAELAEDLTNDAFVKLAGRFRDLRDPAAFGAYLRTTVLNLTRSHFRRRRTERRSIEKLAADRARPAGGPGFDERDRMWSILHTLPVRQRTVVVLRYYEDLSEIQTADLMGCSVSAVKSLTNRAITALREKVEVTE